MQTVLYKCLKIMILILTGEVHTRKRISKPCSRSIPNAYIQNFEEVKAGGRFEFSALAKGIYNGERESYRLSITNWL